MDGILMKSLLTILRPPPARERCERNDVGEIRGKSRENACPVAPHVQAVACTVACTVALHLQCVTPIVATQ